MIAIVGVIWTPPPFSTPRALTEADGPLAGGVVPEGAFDGAWVIGSPLAIPDPTAPKAGVC